LHLPNYASKQIRIDSNTLALLEVCNGVLTVAEVIILMGRQLGLAAPLSDDSSFATLVIEALMRLYRFKAVVFTADPLTEPPNGIQWNGGLARSLQVEKELS
jgi:hypothetical protein